MTAEDRPARRFDPRDADPLYVEEQDLETREEFRSGAVVLYLAVILAIVAGAAIAWLWWTFR